jgi:hypothetical protein
VETGRTVASPDLEAKVGRLGQDVLRVDERVLIDRAVRAAQKVDNASDISLRDQNTADSHSLAHAVTIRQLVDFRTPRGRLPCASGCRVGRRQSARGSRVDVLLAGRAGRRRDRPARHDVCDLFRKEVVDRLFRTQIISFRAKRENENKGSGRTAPSFLTAEPRVDWVASSIASK